jgi:DNA-binding NarL/FixJ family response regulator
MNNDHSIISRMMEIGANSYLTKEAGAEGIYEAIAVYMKMNFISMILPIKLY